MKGYRCPFCRRMVDAKHMAAAMGSAGGSKSKRTISPEQQRDMQEARRLSRLKKKS
jgi:hypothetical protein